MKSHSSVLSGGPEILAKALTVEGLVAAEVGQVVAVLSSSLSLSSNGQ